jgi:hypothetical protein
MDEIKACIPFQHCQTDKVAIDTISALTYTSLFHICCHVHKPFILAIDDNHYTPKPPLSPTYSTSTSIYSPSNTHARHMQSCTSDAQCATQLPCKEGAQREVSGGSKDWFRFQLTDGQSLDLPLSQEKGRVQRDGGKNSSEVFLSCTTGLVSIG